MLLRGEQARLELPHSEMSDKCGKSSKEAIKCPHQNKRGRGGRKREAGGEHTGCSRDR